MRTQLCLSGFFFFFLSVSFDFSTSQLLKPADDPGENSAALVA